MKEIRIGDVIREVDVRNTGNNTSMPILGISSFKYFFITRSKFDRSQLSNYKVIKARQFGLDLMNVTRTARASVALKEGDPALISQAYHVFESKDESVLLPEYLMIFFNNPEFERRLLFITDNDVRGTIKWEDFLNLTLPLPSIEKQREYADIYNGLMMLRNNHEQSFGELQKLTDSFMDVMAQKYEMKELGGYIEQTDKRNRDLGCKRVQGISIQKKFIDSKANMVGVSLHNYKIVDPSEFAYVTVTSRNGEKISVALNENERCIVSATYITFKTTDELLPEYLLLWFKRPEFDRYARFNSWGSARETFDWSEMQRVKLPVPPIEVQQSIIAVHHASEMRKNLNERIKTLIKKISPVLIKNAKDLCSDN